MLRDGSNPAESANRAASLADCTAPLGVEDQRELRRYWDRVIWQEWVRPSRFVPSPVPSAAEREREQRRAARAMARVAATRGRARGARAGGSELVLAGEAA